MRLSTGDKIFDYVNIAVLILLSALFLVPFISVVATSLISGQEFATRGQFILFPHRPTLSAYHMLLGQGSTVIHAYMITVLRVVIGTSMNLLRNFQAWN